MIEPYGNAVAPMGHPNGPHLKDALVDRVIDVLEVDGEGDPVTWRKWPDEEPPEDGPYLCVCRTTRMVRLLKVLIYRKYQNPWRLPNWREYAPDETDARDEVLAWAVFPWWWLTEPSEEGNL